MYITVFLVCLLACPLFTLQVSAVHLTINWDALLLSKVNACICIFHTSVSPSLLYTLDTDSVEPKSNRDGIPPYKQMFISVCFILLLVLPFLRYRCEFS